MKNKVLWFAMLMLAFGCLRAAQVTIIVNSLPANTPAGSQVYIAGSINNWNPGDAAYILEPNTNGHPTIVLEGTGTISFKFTRGSWAIVEGNANGGYLPNRSFTFGSADTLNLAILSWEDLGGPNSTAAENVSIMSTNFFMPQFNRNRRIWLYLPPDYETSGIDYPVLYMHDGQNLFDVATAFAGEWQVDEALNQLHAAGKPVPIVVGVDNGGEHRIAEYTPWANSQYGGGDGQLYAEFIVETLKPYIDDNYRTLVSRQHTGIMGSSLGGLISFYIAHKYQDVFSKAGVFSPSFWFSDQVYVFASETGKEHSMKYYFMGGGNESATLIPKMQEMVDTLQSVGFLEDEIMLLEIPGGQHNEALWRTQFKDAYEWLFLANPTSTGMVIPDLSIIIKNHGRNIWIDGNGNLDETGSMVFQLYCLSGQMVYSAGIETNTVISLPHLPSGLFVARVSNNSGSVFEKIFLP